MLLRLWLKTLADNWLPLSNDLHETIAKVRLATVAKVPMI